MVNDENKTLEYAFVEDKQAKNQSIKYTQALGKDFWWIHYKDKNGYKEAFKEVFFTLFKQNLETLDKDTQIAEKFNKRSNNNSDLYYWLKFWLERGLEIYCHRKNDIYYIPVTEFGGTGHGRHGRATHAETRMAYDLFHSGRTTYFPTDIFVETGDEIDIKVGPLDNPQTVCFAAISNVYPYTILNNVQLVENQITIYKANAPGILMLSCINNSHGMESWGKKIEITLLPKKTNKGKKIPLFIYGIHSQKDWITNFSQQPNPFNQIQLFNGLHRIYIPGDITKRVSSEVYINQLLSEYLLIGATYDMFNGFDGSSNLHLPTQDLQIITFERCGYSETDLVAVCNDLETRNSKTKFVDWHELGHQNTMGWSWGTEIEVVANLYELIAERLFKGKNNWGIYDIYYYAPEYFDSKKHGTCQAWDPHAVANFIKTNVQLYDLQGGYDVMSSTTYDERNPQYQYNEKERRWILKQPQHINNEFLRLQMFYQLLFTYSEAFYAELGKAYREKWNFCEGWETFNTNQKDKNWFVKTACDITKTNLLPFFDKWGLRISPEVRKKIEAQEYSFPI